MTDASFHDRWILLGSDVAENATLAAHYLGMTPTYANLNDRAGMAYSLKCAMAHFKAAIASFKEMEALDAPIETSGDAGARAHA